MMAHIVSQKKHVPYVPVDRKMVEFSYAAVILGLVMSVVLGAANAYLGLKAGITIAATYPAAVIGMALLRFKRGTILEENLARTAGSIGESIAAGAIRSDDARGPLRGACAGAASAFVAQAHLQRETEHGHIDRLGRAFQQAKEAAGTVRRDVGEHVEAGEAVFDGRGAQLAVQWISRRDFSREPLRTFRFHVTDCAVSSGCLYRGCLPR